jgi:hypothetical protein
MPLFANEMTRCTVIAASLVCTTLASGCSGGRRDLADVRGTVKMDGQPLVDALVQFVPQGSPGVTSLGRTDSSGNYYMMATRSATGASLGENKVRITTYEILDEGGKQKVVKERVPTKYNSATELVVTVKSRGNKFDFDLSTSGGKVEKMSESPSRIQ